LKSCSLQRQHLGQQRYGFHSLAPLGMQNSGGTSSRAQEKDSKLKGRRFLCRVLVVAVGWEENVRKWAPSCRPFSSAVEDTS
jgi:hypothetical protein